MFKHRNSCFYQYIYVALLTCIEFSFADQNHWSTSGPDGASVVAFAINPFYNEKLFLGTLENGIFYSVNMGDNWNHMNNDSLAPEMCTIVIHPDGPDTLIAGTWRGIFKSTDSGLTWHRPTSGWSVNETECIEYNPINPSILLAAGGWVHKKSNDGGETWRNLELHSLSLMAIRFHPYAPDTAYLATQSGLSGMSVFKSSDCGDTWYCIHNNLDSNIFLYDLIIDKYDPRTIYVAGDNYYHSSNTCIAKSTNGGESWFDISPTAMRFPTVMTLAISFQNHNIIFAGTYYDGLFISTDAGETWSVSDVGIRGCAIRNITIDSLSGNIYAGTFNDGAYISTDNGSNWRHLTNDIFQASCYDMSLNQRNPESVYVSTGNGLFISADSANSWQYLDIGYPSADRMVYSAQVDPINPNYVYAAIASNSAYDDCRVHYSTDGGITWNNRSNGLPTNVCFERLKIGLSSDSNQILFLSTAQGLYESNDLGENWSIISSGLPLNAHYYAIGLSLLNPEIVYVGDDSGNLYGSFDGGVNWSSITIPSSDWYINDIVCDPQNPDIIYITMELIGIFKSMNRGQSWLNITNNLPADTSFFLTSGLVINPLNTDNLYVNSYRKGFFVSNDGGQSWQNYSEGLPQSHKSGITIINPSDTAHIYLATSTCSVWSIRRNTNEIVNNDNMPSSYILYPNYPNPFNSSTTIRYTIPIAGPVTLDIYDILGRKVQTLLEIQQSAGEHQITWEADNFGSGMYFYRLRSEDRSITRPMILLK